MFGGTTCPMEFITESTSHSVAEFYEMFGQNLPKVVIINQPLSDGSSESTPEKNQLIRLHCVSIQRRILAKVNKANDHTQMLILPVTFPGRACVMSEQATNDQWDTLKNVVANNSLPVSILFSPEEFVTVEDQSVVLNVDDTLIRANELHVPAMELLKTFDETHLLGNYILNGVLQPDVVQLPLHHSNLQVTTVKGIRGHSNEIWNNFIIELDRASAGIYYDQEFGFKDIATYDPAAIDTESWMYIKPANYFKKWQLADKTNVAHMSTPSSDSTTNISDSKTSTEFFNDFDKLLTRWASSNLEKLEEDLDLEKCRMAYLNKSTTIKDSCMSHVQAHDKQADEYVDISVLNVVDDQVISMSENSDGSERQTSSSKKCSEMHQAMVAAFTHHATTDIMSDFEHEDKVNTSKQLISLTSVPLPSETQMSSGIQHGSTKEATSCRKDLDECTFGVIQCSITIDEASGQCLEHCKELENDCELLQLSKDVPISNDSSPKCPAYVSNMPLLPLDVCVNTRTKAPPVAPKRTQPNPASKFNESLKTNASTSFSLVHEATSLKDDMIIIDRNAIKKMASIPNAGGIEKLTAKYVSRESVKDSSEGNVPSHCNSTKTNQSSQKHREDKRVFTGRAKVSGQNQLQSTVSSIATPMENKKLNVPPIRDVCSAVDVKKLTIDEVVNYLKMLNLHVYIESFRQQLVDGRLLSELDKSILTNEFGMKTVEAIRLMNFVKDGYIPS